MTLTGYYAPGIWIDSSSSWWPLPRPINSLVVGSAKRVRSAFVPGADGEIALSPSEGAVQITVDGMISKDNTGAVTIDEAARLTVMQTLITKLQGDSSDSDQFWLVTHYNSGASEYLYFKDCICGSYQFDLADAGSRGIPYKLVIKANDPAVYTTAAGNLV